MMGDDTEEQNLSETGIQKSRIKKDEVRSKREQHPRVRSGYGSNSD